MLPLPRLLLYELRCSESPSRKGGGASSGEALRELGDRGLGGSSSGVEETD